MIGIIILTAIIIISSLWLYLVPRSGQTSTIPGMTKSSKEKGNLDDLQKAGSLYEFLSQLHAKYGPIASFGYGQTYTVSIASPQLFKEHSHPFDRPPQFFKMFEPLLGSEAIQFANGADGQNRRKVYDRAYRNDKLSTYYDMFQKSADMTVEKWDTAKGDDPIALCKETFAYSVRTALRTVVGELFEDDDVVQNFHAAYVKAQEQLRHYCVDPNFIHKGESKAAMDEALNYMHTTIRQGVKQRQAAPSRGNLVIDSIVEIAPSQDVIQHDCMTYLLGSFHNVGNVLAWSLYYLSKHDEVQEKAYKEIVDVLGDTQTVDKSTVNKLVYLKQVIDESTRLGMFGIFAARIQDADSELGGYKIPKNTPVLQALGVVMMDEKLWPSPKTFDPERFNQDNTHNRHPFAFRPFGFAGKRVCPGFKYTHLLSAVFLATVLRRFRIKLYKDEVVEAKHDLTTHPSEEIWINVAKREK